MGKLFLPQLATAFVLAACPAVSADYPNEFWIDQQQGWVIETKPCTTGLCGYLVDFPAAHRELPSGPEKDVHNPDPRRRGSPLCGLLLMGGFHPSSPDAKVWEDGWVYDPQSGSTYSGTITKLDADTVSLRGYIGISLFGKTLNLRRVNDTPGRCSALR